MASKTTVQPSCVQKNPEVDECRENIPPGGTAAVGTSKLKVQVGDMIEYSSAQPSGENKPLSDTCFSSTPAPASSNGGVKAKSRISGLQSALTPILKYLNIGNKGSSPEPLKRGNNPRLSVPFCVTTADCQNSTGGSRQNPNSDLSSSHSGRSLNDEVAPMCWLYDEQLPEITLLNDTCDSTMQMTRNDSALPDSMPATPVKTWTVNSTFPTLQPSQLSSSTNINTTAHKPCPQNETVNPLQSSVKDKNSELYPPELPKHNGTTTSTDLNDKMVDIPESMYAPERWLDDRYFPEITLLDVTRDSEPSPGAETSPMEATQDNPPVDSVKNRRPSSEMSGQIVAEPGRLDMIQSEESSSTLTGNVTQTLSSFSEQSDKCVEENVMKASSDVTRDISMGSVLESSRSSSEPCGQNMAKSQTSDEDTLGTHPANVTRDISSSSDMSVQSAETSDVQCNTSLKNVTSELHVKTMETSNTVEANNEELITTHDAELTGIVPQPSPETAKSSNGTFTIGQPSTDLNTTAQISCPHNKTLDLPPSNGNRPKAQSEATEQVSADFKNTTETSLIMNQSSSAGNASGSCEVNNATFDRHSLQKSSGNTYLGEASATSVCLQNTFDSKPTSKQNGTITLSETSSSDSHQNTLDKPSPPKVCNPTTSPNDDTSEGHPPELPKQNVTTTITPESTFEANSAVEVASGASGHEAKDHSHPNLPATDSLSDALGHQSMAVESNKANAFNLDDTLDLKVDSLVTSTPMTNSKVFHFSTEREDGKTIAAQKKLYGYGPSNPVGQVPSDVPSNIVSDRKTFLTQPTARSLLPPAKAASQLLKYKPAIMPLRRCEPSTSGLPMTRQRAQAEVLKNTAASDAAQGTTGISSSYNLRATTTGSNKPNSGLLRPPLMGIPSGIQRATAGLRPPSARSNALTASSTDKLHGPTVANPVTRASQPKKHPLTRGEALPTAKKKKMDAPLPSSSTEAPASSCDPVNRAKNLKQPTTSKRPVPAKTQRDDTAVPASTAETIITCDAASRARTLKQPANSHRGLGAKPQGHGCAKCVVLEEQLKIKSEEIRRLKAELLKYSKHGEQC
ncbi:mucin-5AC-like isoform X1 [Seriola lalandi dorsalis]|uniref:mucin-5AC-like isoform X1 n=1 Tax=Seriola lalandi dorsalis TaxID=1841481 RepID=UPI000C6FB7D3|nr:mucin-5AC-like isoform X1 [Seriola lalandi dorsalis]